MSDYWLGVITPFGVLLFLALILFLVWGVIGKANYGHSGCPHCAAAGVDSPGFEPFDKTHLQVFSSNLRHRFISRFSRAHRVAWQEWYDKNEWVQKRWPEAQRKYGTK
jgi:hypothetical protein